MTTAAWSAATPTGGYASKAEAKMAARLALLQSAGVVSEWLYVGDRPGYVLTANGVRVGMYRPDFWCLVIGRVRDQVMIEVKGRISRDWPIRRRVFEACYPLIVLHVVSSDEVDAYDPRAWPPKRPSRPKRPKRERAKRLSLAGAEKQ